MSASPADRSDHHVGGKDHQNVCRVTQQAGACRGGRRENADLIPVDLRKAGTAKVRASLSYLYSPPILREQQLDIELGSAERYVN